MKKNILPVFLCCLAIMAMLFWQSCQKNLSGDGITPPINNTPVTAGVAGRVTDDENKPLQGAVITAGTATATTNVNGEFTINNTSLNKNAGVIKVVKPGFFNGFRTIVVNEGKQHFVQVKMIKKNLRGIIDAGAGGALNMASGMKLSLSAGTVVVKSTGTAYTGQVSVAEGFINPVAKDGNLIMPGDLRGINANGEEKMLQSFGMVAIELLGAGGEELQIATGKTAALSFPIPASLQGNAPGSIALWSFDETTGLWKEEGTASKNGTVYEGTVKHFSFWNCDVSQPLVDFSATFKDQNGNPIRYATVKLTVTSMNGIQSWGYTDSAGYVHGKIFANATFRLELISQCETTIHTQTFNTTSAAANLGSITVTVTSTQATVSGTAITCAGTPVTNGYTQILVDGRYYNANITNGVFSLPITLCSTPITATVMAVDIANTQQGNSTTLSLNAGVNATGQLNACGTSIQQFVNWTVNGVSYSLIGPTDSLNASYVTQAQGFPVPETQIAAYNFSTSFNEIEFTFEGLSNTTSVHQLKFISSRTLDTIPSAPNIAVNITEYGAAGQFIAGNFSGVASSNSGNKTITCNFRIRRQR
jgi:hypothetical protein